LCGTCDDIDGTSGALFQLVGARVERCERVMGKRDLLKKYKELTYYGNKQKTAQACIDGTK